MSKLRTPAAPEQQAQMMALDREATRVVQECKTLAAKYFPNNHIAQRGYTLNPYGHQMVATDAALAGVIFSKCLEVGGENEFKRSLVFRPSGSDIEKSARR